MCDDFEQLCQSHRVWDTISERGVDRAVERTTAHSRIERRPVRFQRGFCDLIDSEWPVPHLENANGGDVYLFPTFLLYRVSATNFALLEYPEVEASYRQQRFIEDEEVPADAVVVDHTWAKANKDGSPDRRFSNNYQIPVVRYGKLRLSSATGLNEEYLISNDERLRAFSRSLDALIASIKAVTSASPWKPPATFNSPENAAQLLLRVIVPYIQKAGIRCQPAGVQRYARTVRFDVRPADRVSPEQLDAARRTLVTELKTGVSWVGLVPQMHLGLEVPDTRISAIDDSAVTEWLVQSSPEWMPDQEVLERLCHRIEEQVRRIGSPGQVVNIEFGREILRFELHSEGASRLAQSSKAVLDSIGCSIAVPTPLRDRLHLEIPYGHMKRLETQAF